jgi:long-chain fatty acid transport protein
MRRTLIALSALAALLFLGTAAHAQSFGIELHNTLMPAAGGMGGVSIAQPQDLTSALNANPAALTQFQGTQFLFGGGWVEPTFNLTQTSNVPVIGPDPLVEPYSAKSTVPGSPVGNIGVTQDLSELGMPATFGMGFVTTAGGAADFRHVPESNGTNTAITIFSLPVALGVDLTERPSVGAALALGIAYFDGPFVGVGGMTPDYALRGTVGATLLSDATTIGGYYQTEQKYQFDNAFILDPGQGRTALTCGWTCRRISAWAWPTRR